MADYFAVAATCEAVINVLRQSWSADVMDYTGTINFTVYDTEDFKTPMSLGISLFVYHISIDNTHRTFPPRKRDDDRKNRRELPLNVHFILTPWGQSASQVLTLSAWMMRIIEDNTVLSSGLLNEPLGEVFYDDEAVKVTPAGITSDESLRIWEQLPNDFHLSTAYRASILRIESFRDEKEHEPVIEREYEYGALKD